MTATPPHARLLAIGAVIFTLLGWSSVPLFIREFSHEIDPWTANGWRYGVSAILWLPVIFMGLARRNLPRGLWVKSIVPGLFNALGQVCFTHTFYKISPGLATFGMRTQIVFVATGAALMFPAERRILRSPAFIVGLIMVMGGAMSIMFLGENHQSLEARGWGLALAIGAGALFACYGLSVRKFMEGVPSLTAFAAISQLTAALMVGLMLVLGERHGATALDLTPWRFALLLFSGIIGIAIGHVAYYYSIAKLGVMISSSVIQLQPLVVATASAFIFKELLTPLQWTAGLVALSGAALILFTQSSKTPASAKAVEVAFESD